jgi:hypothetical protein
MIGMSRASGHEKIGSGASGTMQSVISGALLTGGNGGTGHFVVSKMGSGRAP